MTSCPFCDGVGGHLVLETPRFRVIRADEPGFPAFYRVIWSAHAAEFSELDPAERAHCMEAVVIVEQVLRDSLAPTKINLAALGNMVPHLHWHVIARFDWDTHFPAPVWASPRRERDAACEARVVDQRTALEAEMVRRLTSRSF